MRKAGIILSVSGFITMFIVSALFYYKVIMPFPFYMAMMFGAIVFPFGLAFLVLNKDAEQRKKIEKVSFIISFVLLAGGIFSTNYHVPGARIEVITGIVFLCFFYGTIKFKNKYETWKIYARSKRDAFVLSLFDFVGMGAMMLAALFTLQQWPGAKVLLFSGALIMFVGVIIWKRILRREVFFRKEAEDKVKVALEKIEESHKEISDSIQYAKRLQDAILPREAAVKAVFPDNFILYKPKAIVAGDFYWFEQKNGYTFLAAADCTGHGVPGAIVSVVCSNALNRAVLEMNLTDPGKILDKVTELVLETFQKSGEDVKDGMDISLLRMKEAGGEGRAKNFSWSGANNPLWIVSENGLTEIKADKQPVGLYENRKPFTTHALELKQGDSLYLFTDGYADQFGGPKGKKFKYKQISEKLLNIRSKKMNEQKEILAALFAEWKGNLEQVDDICIIGVKI